MDQLAQRAFVKSEAVGGVESARAGAAQRAAALEIQRIAILERGLALGAEVLGGVSGGSGEAGGADRNARVADQGPAADAAVIGKEDRKKSVGNLPRIETGKLRDSLGQSTREGSPPMFLLAHNRPFSCNSWHATQCRAQGTAAKRFL